VLVQKGILEKQRGQPMAVAAGARIKIMTDRQENEFHSFIANVVDEAKKIELSEEKLIAMIHEYFRNSEGSNEHG